MTNILCREHPQPRPEFQSQVIEFLRFPLIVCFIFYHNADYIDNFVHDIHSMSTPLLDFCMNIFRGPLAFRNQLFFFVSGFLFFINIVQLDILNYKNKIRNRLRTLFIPYLSWNFAMFILFFILNIIPQINVNKEVDWYHFFDYFYQTPIVYQFWFVRDLMMAVLLTPIIYFFCKKTKIFGVLFLGVLWYFDWWFTITGLSSVCIFFFTAGAYFGINKRNLIKDFGKIRSLSFVLYPVIAIADILTMEYDFNHYIHRVGIIMGIIFSFNLVSYWFGKDIIKPTKFLAAATFFVFAVHEPLLLKMIYRLSLLIFSPQSDLAFTTLFFVNVILTALGALGLYYFLRRFLPGFTRIITGGR